MKNRFASYIIALIMALSLIPAEALAYSSEPGHIIANLTSINSIISTEFTAVSTPVKDSEYSAKLEKLTKSSVTISNVDFSFAENGYVEYWVYSGEKSGMNYSLVLTADNPDTAGTDYYYTVDTVNHVGWKRVAVKLPEKDAYSTDNMTWEEYEGYLSNLSGNGVFVAFGSPADITKVKEIKITKSFPDEEAYDTDLYFGNIEYHKEMSSEAILSKEENSKNTDELVLADFSSGEAASKTPWEYSRELGAVKISKPNLDKTYTITVPEDWSAYNTINVEAYSNINDRNRISIIVYSENSATSGEDYYRGEVIFNWAEKWKTTRFTYDNKTGTTDMKVSRTPLGFNKIDKFVLSCSFGNNVITDDKEIYIKRIYLTNVKNASPEYSDNTDYIPAAQLDGVDMSIAENLRNTINPKQHPRLLTTAEDLKKNIELYKSGKNVYLENTMNNILSLADAAVGKAPAGYGTTDGTRLQDAEFEAIRPLAVAFAVTGEQKYRDRLWAALKEMASWPDWLPDHLLRTCEAAYSFGLAYDLCYDTWTEDEKRIIRNAIVKHGIMPALKQWRNGEYPSDTTTNWQLVCAGGVGFAAMAIIDEPGYMDLCMEIVSRTIETIPLGLSEYKDNGSYPEGIGYWKYATPYLFSYIKSLKQSLGTDYGLSQYQGLSDTGFFPIISSGPKGTYNFSDGSLRTDGIKDACMFYLAKLYDKPVLADFYVQSGMTTGEWDSFILYDDTTLTGEDYRKQMPLDYIYGGAQQNVYTRSSWDGTGSVWLAYKGRYGNAAHSDLDAGSFILDMQGIRWFADLGSGDYDAEGYFDVDDLRWDFYRKRAEAHNTLVLNPDIEPDQEVYAVSEITDFKHTDYASYGIVDLTTAYPEATDVKRAIGLVNNRSEVIIRDEIKTSSPLELYSFFTTEHSVEISPDGKTAFITAKTGEMIRVDLITDTDAKWQTMRPEPLSTSPDPEGNYTNKGNTVSLNIDNYTKLYLHLNNVTNPTISYKISSCYTKEDIVIDEILPIENWDNYLTMDVWADNLYIDDIPVENFTPGNAFYTLKGGVGNIKADYDSDKFDVSYIQATKIGDTAQCIVTDKQSGKTAKYYVNFKDIYVAVNPDIFEQIKITSAEATSVPEPQNGPDNSYDGDLLTVSTFNGEGEIIWTLDNFYDIDRVLIAFSKGDQRYSIFDIYTSADKENWSLAYSGRSSGNSSELEIFEFTSVQNARYVKLSGHGNSLNGWNSILEIFVPKAISEFADTNGHWAEQSIKRMRNAGLVKGTSSTHFEPERELSVGELLLMIERFMDFAPGNENEFTLVIKSASENNILPESLKALTADRPISRQEMAAILSLCFEKLSSTKLPEISLDRFADKDKIDSQYIAYVSTALASRLLNGTDNNSFAPLDGVTRAQAATVIERLYILKN